MTNIILAEASGATLSGWPLCVCLIGVAFAIAWVFVTLFKCASK